MKKIKFFPLIIALCLVFVLGAPSAYALEEPNIGAEAAVLVDSSTDSVIYSRAMDEKRAPASLTKIMTALLALEAVESGQVSLDEMIVAQDNCRQDLDEDSSTAGIVPGMSLSLNELLYCTLLSSANEACNIIAARIDGSIEAFVEHMNSRAQELGCTNTHFTNTNGLPSDEHYSTAYDLYLITKEAIKHPLFLEICDTKSYTSAIPEINEGKPMENSNALINPNSSYNLNNYVYEYASGVKTGYTRAAGYCLISTAQKDGINLVAVVLGCDGWLNAQIEEYKNFEDSITLYNWAFDNFEYQTVISASEPLGKTMPIENAAGKGIAILKPEKNIELLLPKELTPEDIEVVPSLNSETLEAPIKAGTVLGKAKVYIDGTEYGTINLVASEDVELAGGIVFMQKLKAFFSQTWLIVLLSIVIIVGGGFLLLYLHYRHLKQEHIRKRRLMEQRRAEEERRKWEEEHGVTQPDISYEDDLYSGYDFSDISKDDIGSSSEYEEQLIEEYEEEQDFRSYNGGGSDSLSDFNWDDIAK